MKETDGVYYFNRCRRCMSLITKLEVLRVFAKGGELCSCGSMMFGPTNPIGLEWIKPSVLKMVVYKLAGKLAPPPEDGVVPPVPTFGGTMQRVSPLSQQERELLK